MFGTDTTGTPTLINRVGRAGVSAVPEGTLGTSTHYGACGNGSYAGPQGVFTDQRVFFAQQTMA